MFDKLTKVIVLIAIGWILGYMHHFMVTRDILQDFSNRILWLEQDMSLANAGISQVFKEVITLNQKFNIGSDFKVTGYSNDPGSINVPRWRDGRTATGVKATPGICAADWDLIPVGTLVWIDDYGWCEIQDRGGKVKGRHIDLFFDDVLDAKNWGVRKTDIVIADLEE
ncbi:MAG: hypothetical protein GXP46_01705 [Deferribacteres bacterium]|nr:hypothetical protein [Deferribacteres bacterium]